MRPKSSIDLVIVGGFLGVGKTTTLSYLARILTRRGRKVGIVTNDQGRTLVDTKFQANLELPVVEVVGGCFCCRFDDLVTQADALISQYQVDIILAEPVGSCTDLVATVCKPLESKYGDIFRVKPFTVIVDPLRVRELLFLDSGYSEDVQYLFCTQLQEADMILLNKIDTLPPAEKHEMISILRERFQPWWISGISAARGEGIEEWWQALHSGDDGVRQPSRVVDVDYIRYTRAESELGWLNAELTLRSTTPFEPKPLLDGFLRALTSNLKDLSAEVAHVKLWIESPSGSFRVSVTSLRETPRWDGSFSQTCRELQVTLNARVATDPKLLQNSVVSALESFMRQQGGSFEIRDVEAFRPAPPKPTYRMA